MIKKDIKMRRKEKKLTKKCDLTKDKKCQQPRCKTNTKIYNMATNNYRNNDSKEEGGSRNNDG